MTKLSALLGACAALALASTAASAQMAPANKTAPAAKTAAMAPAKAPEKVKGPATTAPKTAESKACSAEADAKGLHGKARKAFRSKCKEDAAPAAKAGVAAAVKAEAKTPAPK